MTERMTFDLEASHSSGSSQQEEMIPADRTDTVSQVEDAVMKVMMEFFSEEMLPFFGITQKAAAFSPTEEIHLELKKEYH